jgi:hypothetical protein
LFEFIGVLGELLHSANVVVVLRGLNRPREYDSSVTRDRVVDSRPRRSGRFLEGEELFKPLLAVEPPDQVRGVLACLLDELVENGRIV